MMSREENLSERLMAKTYYPGSLAEAETHMLGLTSLRGQHP
jgi:hypothetical protein